MILERIIFINSKIKVFCVKSEAKEYKTITPDLVQYITVSYSIRLINSPGRKVTEQIKLNKKEINFIEKFVVFSFQITDLSSPDTCELNLHTLTFYFNELPPLKVTINKTHTFRSIQSATAPIIPKEKIQIPHESKIKQKKEKFVTVDPSSKRIIKKKDVQTPSHFTDSYEKFKSRIQDTDFLNLLQQKTGSIDFSLKSFGISLLCKLVLLITYLNKLVDNDFQQDLQEFLKSNILENIKKEVPV